MIPDYSNFKVKDILCHMRFVQGSTMEIERLFIWSVSVCWLSFRNTRCGMQNDTLGSTVPI